MTHRPFLKLGTRYGGCDQFALLVPSRDPRGSKLHVNDRLRYGENQAFPANFPLDFLFGNAYACNDYKGNYCFFGDETMLPNGRELVILSILMNGEKYGREIRTEVEKRTKKSFAIGSLYTTLDRMEEKGLIKSREGEALPGYAGNRRRYYRLTAEGSRSFDSARSAFDTGWQVANG